METRAPSKYSVNKADSLSLRFSMQALYSASSRMAAI